jgi:hypothetical protein
MTEMRTIRDTTILKDDVALVVASVPGLRSL